MPLPDDHVRQLRTSLELHERRLTHLERQIRSMQEEAEYHRALLALGRDARLIAAASEAFDAPAAPEPDAAALLSRRGVELPHGSTLAVSDEAAKELLLTVDGAWGEYQVRWNADTGFSCTGPESAG